MRSELFTDWKNLVQSVLVLKKSLLEGTSGFTNKKGYCTISASTYWASTGIHCTKWIYSNYLEFNEMNYS